MAYVFSKIIHVLRRSVPLLGLLTAHASAGPVCFTNDFAALDSYVKPAEQPWRQEICLNGSWLFQPVKIPDDWTKNQGTPPALPSPADHWESTPIRIPSPWNANTWGCGREVGAGTPHPYWPDSVYFPDYPRSWDGVQMGWLKKSFQVPDDWAGKRILLHFQAVSGDCHILVNGHPAGEHFDNFLPFDLDITKWVNRHVPNELLVGIRSARLFDQTNALYPHESATYPDGSSLDGIVGIWQDVYLLAVPPVRVTDTFVQPWVDRNELLVETTLRNDTDQPQQLVLAGSVSPWINDAGTDILSAPEARWHLGNEVLALPGQTVQVPPGTNLVVTLKVPVKNSLKLWSPATPNLYGLLLTVTGSHQIADRKYQRFGWRQFTIHDDDLFLNGKKFQIAADILHPFGVFTQSRRTAWAWFKMIKDVGGNGVRLHAQPWPSFYEDLADEMGLVVLDEDALFGSSLRLNFTDPVSWQRFTEHFQALVLRDRNHPSVFGWSFGNELFAIFDYNKMIPADRDQYYARLAELGRGSYALDPTRQWISCDGDEDLRGTLPDWSKHFGLGLHLDLLPAHAGKPLMIGESGGTYYARPSQLAVFNGERAYASYAGRNEALAMDVYQNIVQMARPRLAYFSASELVWFGLEHLPLGYTDFTRLPTLQDGVFFKPFVEGRPGMQPERIPPYVTTLDPGFDSRLPLYKPLAMFDAIKAALSSTGPQPSPWDHLPTLPVFASASSGTAITNVGFFGNPSGNLFAALKSFGVPLATSLDNGAPATALIIVDAQDLTDVQASQIKPQLDTLLARGNRALLCLKSPPADLTALNQLLPYPVSFTPREATALVRGDDCSLNQAVTLSDLYFAENKQDNHILKCALDGDLVRHSVVIFKASDTDWSQFNDVREDAKCAAVELYEKFAKPSGSALISIQQGSGTLLLSTVNYVPNNPDYTAFWRMFFNRLGVKLSTPIIADLDHSHEEHDLLLNGPKQ